MSDPTEIYTQGYMVGAAPVGVFTQGWFSVSHYRPLLDPLNPALANPQDTSKIPINRDVFIGISPWAQGLEGPKPGS